jgi:lipopolysaccharide heptosyltransferase I
MATDGQPRIIIARLSAIGDIIHGLPVLCALRRELPAAFISWIVEGRAADLLKGHPDLDELIVVPRGWLKSPSAIWQVRRQLRALRCNVAIDLQGLTKSAIAAKLSGARRRIGFAAPAGRELSSWLNNERFTPTTTHVIEQNLELLQSLITHPPRINSTSRGDARSWANVEYHLPETATDAALAESLVSRSGLRSGFAVLNPGAGWPSKIWPAERFAAVACHLGKEQKLPSLVVWAGEQERYWANEIVSNSDCRAILAPPTNLTELAAIIRRAKLFVGSDTGPLHLATAVDTPCVGLFGPMPAERNGPYGPKHIAVQKVTLQGSSRSRRTAGPKSMLAIEVQDVIEACDSILSNRTAKRDVA